MTIAPLFEIIAVIAITALSFAPITNNYQIERERAMIGSASAELGAAAEKIQLYCDDHTTDCTGATWASLKTAGLITAVDVTKYTADITVVSAGTNGSFVLAEKSAYAADPLTAMSGSDGNKVSFGTNTTGYLCFSPQSSGLYASTAATCT